MLSSFTFSLNATVPVFLLILLGGVFKHAGLINDEFASIGNKFVFRICLPCLLFKDLADTDVRHNFNFGFVAFCFCVTLCSIIVIWVLARLFIKDRYSTGSFVQGSFRSSAAILGAAFIENMYGNSGMAPLMIIGAVPLYNIFSVIILTFESRDAIDSKGQKMKGTGKIIKKTCLNVLKNPIIIGIFIGIVFSFFNIPQIFIFRKTVENLSAMTSPLALIAIGAQFRGREAVKKLKLTVIASFLKLIGLAAAGIFMAVLLGFRGQYLVAIAIMLASPNTPTSYVMAREMNNDDTLASSIVVTTTVFASVTLTFWIFLLKTTGLI